MSVPAETRAPEPVGVTTSATVRPTGPANRSADGPPYYFEDFVPGRVFRHHWGRTVTDADSLLFATQTHLYQPRSLNADYARHNGTGGLPLAELLVFSIVLGLSVEDLSESGGAFLGADDISFPSPANPGDTLYAASVVDERRESGSRPGWGVVRWTTVGVNQDGHAVVRYSRSSLVRFRPETADDSDPKVEAATASDPSSPDQSTQPEESTA